MQHRDDLLCDLAEHYGVTDLRALPVQTLAALSLGLPAESRTMRRLSGQQLTTQEMLLATIADGVNLLVWMQTEDARHGSNRPRSILSELTRPDDDRPATYSSGEEFLSAYQKIVGGDD